MLFCYVTLLERFPAFSTVNTKTINTKIFLDAERGSLACTGLFHYFNLLLISAAQLAICTSPKMVGTGGVSVITFHYCTATDGLQVSYYNGDSQGGSLKEEA